MASLHRYILLWLSLAAACTFATEDESEIELDLVFTEEPQDVIVLRGEPFVFNCSAISVTDNRPVNITWRRDGELPVVPDARRFVLPNGSLYFERIVRKKHGRSDEGYYECLARKNGGAIVSRSARLTVAGIERIDTESSGRGAVEGEMIRLPCNLNAVPPGTLIWQRDKQDLPPDPRYTILNSGVLQIEGVIEADTGQYRCSVTNIAASKFSREEELLIVAPEGRKPPEMLLLPQPVTRKVGETVILECAASGLPMPTLTWTFQNGTAVTGPKVDIVGHGNLRIRDLERRHSQMYKCTATSPENTQPVSTHLTKLTVIEPPQIVTQSPSWERQLSDTVRIKCAFSGYPSPKISLFKDGVYKRPIITDKPEYTWVITYLDNTHKGYYQCRAENDAGQVTTTMRLKIKPSDFTPDKPQNVRARVTGPTSLFVEWDPVPPKNGVKVAGYSVHYRNLAGELELQAVTFEANWIELTQLTPFSNVSIYVLAYNKQHASGRSDVIYQLIGEGVPLAAPPVTATPIGASSLKVSWEKLPIHKARGVIMEYDIYYREQDKGSTKVESIQGDVNEYTLFGLQPNKAYDVRVMAKTSKGFPQLTDDEWPWVTVYTNSQHDELEPPNMQVYALNQTAVQVRWWPSSQENRGSAGYQLDVLAIHSRRHKRLIFTPEQLQDTITGLEPDTFYKISLRCLGAVGQEKQQGEPTVRNVKTLKIGEPRVKPSSPPPPQELDAFPLNATAVRLQWYQPKNTAAISFYTLRYKPVQSDLTKAEPNSTLIKHVVVNDNETLERLIGGLQAYTLYEFSVRTHTTTSSTGAYSNAVRCRTGEGLPSAPTNVQYIVRGPGRVELSWKPPVTRNGIISKYLIYYKPDNKPDHKWMIQTENGTTLQAEVDDLQLGVHFVFRLKAKTSVGEGPPSKEIHLFSQNPYPSQPPRTAEHWTQEQQKGIIIGVTIAGIVLIVAIVVIVLRNRCRPAQPAAASQLGVSNSPNSTLPIHFNGTYMPNSNGSVTGMTVDAHTMEALTPMLPPLVENEHSDSKGGSGVNGMPGLRVQCMPNGQVATFLANQDPHNDRHQKTSCLMGNGRTGISVAATVPEGRPDISRDDSPLDGCHPGLRAGEDEDEEEEEGSAQSSLSHSSASTVSPASLPALVATAGQQKSGNAKTDCLHAGAAQTERPAHRKHQQQQQHKAGGSNASGRLDCEDGDGEIDAVVEETESSRLLSYQPNPNQHHTQHTTQPSPSQPTQSTHHRSSLTEYASAPPQSRYDDESGKGLAPSDGDTSGTPLLGSSSQLDESLHYSPKGSHEHAHTELPNA